MRQSTLPASLRYQTRPMQACSHGGCRRPATVTIHDTLHATEVNGPWCDHHGEAFAARLNRADRTIREEQT